MTEKNLSCRAQEVAACCCVDVGTVIDNSDLNVQIEKKFATLKDAQEMLARLKEKAKESAFSGFEVVDEIESINDEFLLKATFTFECQAESMIFQLAMR
ncbi:hypothetical protein A6A19_05680 [Actinobacillus delphinicola]|uniref:Protein of uncharacterized function (DUF406) n=1 Tax=Actinobacillus delphinicola TaxID=51161 RepID=A0A448TTT7_9PAST|nr:DUF406 family protein [Actinobacillus delphinicola]MDG6897480.1 hypothetical protein [Actinobacillus delphinicola]VEJ09295.1 Protein of uncharacterised function (DUF406) [Actinobacillus delphinicola]